MFELSNDETLFKHRLFEPVWDYSHPPCELDSKAIARWFTMRQKHKRPIPIIPVKSKHFEDLAEAKTLIPTIWPDRIGSFDRFEDRVFYEYERVCAKETECLDSVIKHLDLVCPL